MFSAPTPTHGIFQWITLGEEQVLISIDSYNDYEGYTILEFSILEQLKPMRTITHIYTQYSGSLLQLLSTIHATLIENFMQDGKDFGQVVTLTTNHHSQELGTPCYTSQSMWLNQHEPTELSGNDTTNNSLVNQDP